MIGTVARKEFVELVRDGRFKWTAAIMFLLLLTDDVDYRSASVCTL